MWEEMSYNKYIFRTQIQRLSYEYEEDIEEYEYNEYDDMEIFIDEK